MAPTKAVAFEPLYESLEGVERLENYRPGGYHPVKIGDQFRSRYRILHKLGYGSYSTTWLAHDDENRKYVAIKVCTADSKSQEFKILSTLAGSQHASVKCLGATMIPSIIDKFNIQGPNGNHSCYVTIPARASLADVKDGSWIRLFQPHVARILAAQLATAVEHIHARGYVHGDLHLGNILLKMPPDFSQMSVERLYAEYGAPELDPVIPLDGKPLPPGVPSHGIAPAWLGKASEEISSADASIMLSDFGEAFAPSQEQKYESQTPLVIRPPEAHFEPNKPLSFPSDIWTLACSIWAIVAQRPLFEGFLATQDDMTCEHVDALGILPPEWWEKWEARQDKFTEDGRPINRNPFRSWETRFDDSVQQPRRECGIAPFDEEEKHAISSMLRSMLSFRPEDRPTAKHVLESSWMVKWALPEYYKSKDTFEV
ncbi:hypothetical protein ABOM_001763 [Aspergillus bombycis]|uniref:non-specific serine/threonine protein kinase n=1 Tax=Aspergillus bombycis TaxID=109264 RepID=A0A1F8ADV4_9EURO|nr:hypothetical protein ABOM_001763 [Aspergillus bombycis]OGM49555.1 hypothetical protein ABOM_001763 [Aspergillus bombycis]